MSDISSKNGKTFICYKDDNDQKISGYFEVISVTDFVVSIDSGTHILRIPMHRILKIKESKDG